MNLRLFYTQNKDEDMGFYYNTSDYFYMGGYFCYGNRPLIYEHQYPNSPFDNFCFPKYEPQLLKFYGQSRIVFFLLIISLVVFLHNFWAWSEIRVHSWVYRHKKSSYDMNHNCLILKLPLQDLETWLISIIQG